MYRNSRLNCDLWIYFVWNLVFLLLFLLVCSIARQCRNMKFYFGASWFSSLISYLQDYNVACAKFAYDSFATLAIYIAVWVQIKWMEIFLLYICRCASMCTIFYVYCPRWFWCFAYCDYCGCCCGGRLSCRFAAQKPTVAGSHWGATWYAPIAVIILAIWFVPTPRTLHYTHDCTILMKFISISFKRFARHFMRTAVRTVRYYGTIQSMQFCM